MRTLLIYAAVVLLSIVTAAALAIDLLLAITVYRLVTTPV